MITLIICGLVVTALLLGYAIYGMYRQEKTDRISMRLHLAINNRDRYTPEEEAELNSRFRD